MKASISSLAISAILFTTSALAQLPAFPGAEGFGAYATGGRGGDVYTVYNLNNSGAGSFADAIATAPAAGRTIVFAVSGLIHVNKTRITRDKITISGQTAPGDGIGFKDGPLFVEADDIVIRHARFRYNGSVAGGGDCIDLGNGVTDVMFDHISAVYSTDENISSFEQNPRPDGVTFQWALNSWGLESHSAGGLWDVERVTTHHTLWSHNHTRNPKARPYGLLDWINNVTFDWDIGFIMGDSTTPANWRANIIGNYFICPPGNLRSVALEKARIDRNGGYNFTIHVDDNLYDKDGDSVLDGADYGYGIASGDFRRSSLPIVNGAPYPVTVDDPLTAYKKIVSSAGPLRLDAGSSIPLRDDVDSILIQNLVGLARNHISSPSQSGASNGGYGTLNSTVAPTDSDLDGMPDYWEQSIGSSPTVAGNNNPVPAGAYIPNVPAGYTLLEEYLHFLAIPHAVIPKSTGAEPSSLSVDLRRFTAGFNTAPVMFTLSNIANGAAAIQPDGYTAVFTPTTDFSGRARFDFTVTDGDGSTWTQTLAVLMSTVGLPANLVWHGDNRANVWDEATENFRDGADPVAFALGDNVRFDDAGSRSPAVQLLGTLAPGLVEVDTDLGYSFSGSGSLAGGMSLVKTGAGALTIANRGPNTYVGGTTIREGVVTIGAADALGSGGVTLENNAMLRLGTLSLAGGNTLTISGSPTITGGNGGGLTDIYAVNGSGTLNIVPTSVFDLQGSLSGFNGTLAFAGNQNVRFYGSTGASSVAFDLGDGSLNLNKRSNAGTMTLGALSGGPNTTLQGASGSGNTTATTYLIGGKGTDSTFAGTTINGQGTTGITKTGPGVLTLSGNNTFTGTSTVDDGTLRINGNHVSSPVVVNSGGTLGGQGTLNGLLTVNSGGACAPGDTVGALTAAGGVTLNSPVMSFDLGSSPPSGNDQLLMSGGLLTMTGTQTYQFNLVDGALGAGTYWLIDGAANSSASGVAFVHNLPAGGRQTFNMQRPASGSGAAYVRLVVTGDPASLVWQGSPSTTWDLVTGNWLNGGTPDHYYNFDQVRFDDGAATGAVIVSGALQPLSVTVSNDALPYTFGGGTLSGPMQLTKRGPGTLTVNNTFTHTGGTFIEDGTVVLAVSTSLGANPVTLAGGALAPVSGDFTIPLVVDGAGTFLAGSTGHTYVKAPVTGSGLLTIAPAGYIWTYEDDLSGFTGTLRLSGPGSLRLNQGAYTWGSPDCTFDLGDQGILNNRATTEAVTVYLGALAGGPGATLMASQQSSGTGLVDDHIVGDLNLDTTFAGAIVDGPSHAFALSKVGSGRLTLAGASTYSGGTTVGTGTLAVNNASGSGTGSGPLDVLSGATLTGNGILGGPATLADGAILAPGDGVGTLTFDDSLSLDEFSELQFELGSASDQVSVLGDLFAAGALQVTAAAGFGPGAYTLFTANALTLGTISLASLPADYDYTIDTASPGEVRLVVASPTPAGIDSLTLDGGQLVLSGQGGAPLAEFFTLGTTNLLLPPAAWDRLATNLFDASGIFSITNTIQPDTPDYFYSIELP